MWDTCWNRQIRAWCFHHGGTSIPFTFLTTPCVDMSVLWTCYCFVFEDIRGESCSRSDLECLGPPLPPLCSRLVWTRPASAYPHFVWLWFCFFTIQRLAPLTFTPLNCWYHWPTHSTSAASRPSSWVLTPASVKWCTGAWLWSRRAREATLYIYSLVNLFLCSAHIHHHILPLALSLSINHRITMNILKVAVWLKISERCCWCACTPLWLLLTILRPIGGLQSPLSITPLAWHFLTEVIPTQSTVTDLYRNKRNNLIKSYHAVEN